MTTQREYPLTLSGYTYQVAFRKTKYVFNGRLAIVALDPESEEVVTFVSTNLKAEPLTNDKCFWCKSYSENEGLAEQLEALGIAKPTGRYAASGFVTIPEFELIAEIEGN